MCHEEDRGDKKGCKVPSLGSDWVVVSDRSPAETTSSPETVVFQDVEHPCGPHPCPLLAVEGYPAVGSSRLTSSWHRDPRGKRDLPQRVSAHTRTGGPWFTGPHGLPTPGPAAVAGGWRSTIGSKKHMERGESGPPKERS